VSRLVTCSECRGSYDTASPASVESHFAEPGHTERVRLYRERTPPLATPVPDAAAFNSDPDDDPKTDPRAMVTFADLKTKQRVQRWVVALIATLLGGGGGLAGYFSGLALVRTEARAQAREEVRDQMKDVARIDAGHEGLKARVSTLEQQVPQLREEVYAGRVETSEMRKDIRALADELRSGRESARLSTPVPTPKPPAQNDGGTR